MKRRVTYVIEYLLDDFNNAMIEAMPYNAYRQMTNASKPQANPSCGKTKKSFSGKSQLRQDSSSVCGGATRQTRVSTVR